MRIVCGTTLVVLLPLSFALAQAPSTTLEGAAFADNSVPLIKTEARAVVVDVTVTDAQGQAVSNCVRDDFVVLEDGKPQTINFFEAHQAGETASNAEPLPPLPPNVHTNFVDAPSSDAVYVLLLDALNTPMKNQAEVRTQMMNYLRTLRPGQRIAVFTLGSELRMLQGFTSDPGPLLALLNSKAANPQNSLLPAEGDDLDEMYRNLELLRKANISPPALEAFKLFYEDRVSDQLDQRVKMTLEAMQQLSRYLAGVQGRKNLLWFSATFPLVVFPNSESKDPLRNVADYYIELHKTADLMAASRIAVYPVDARGVLFSPAYNASRSKVGREEVDAFQNRTYGERNTMNVLADETGGKAIYNTNDLQQAMAQVIRHGSTYYTLAYTPANRAMNGRFRQIDVKLRHGNYTLAFRRGYYAEPAPAMSREEEPEAARIFQQGMREGYPQASQIIFKARVAPANPQPDASAPKVGQNTSLKGATTRYRIDLAATLAPVRFEVASDGARSGELVIGTVAYGADGTVLNSATRHMTFKMSPREYARMLQTGIPYHQELDVPNRDARLRIGIYDPRSESLGTLEIPLHPAAGTPDHGGSPN